VFAFFAAQVSVRALKGNRITMEDEYIVNDKGNFAAVFDGHGGSGVSRYLRETLQDRMRYFLNDELEVYKEDNEEVKKTKRFLNFLKRQSPGPTIEKTAAALQSAFRSIDREVMMNDKFHYQGSTAVAVLVHESENGSKTLLAANIGDSRAVLSRCKCALNLTRDHKPHLTSEKARIESMGEKVEWDGYLYRVRDLSLSRAIGDRHAKPAVSGEVEISQYPVKEGDEFVIIASDGLWDVMSSQEAVDYVHQKLKYSNDSNESTREVDQAWTRRHMSRFLANEAMDRGTGDNVCVLIMWLNDFNERLKVDK
jgi:serine/threonine protein phosphatase PrpC